MPAPGAAMQSGHDPVAPPVERGGDLQRLARMAREVGLASLAAEAERVAERVAEGRFYVVCVGQFKRGKSTLLNALVGDAVLPAGVVPVTSVVTVLRYGAARGARIRRGGRDWEAIPLAALPAYVSEEGNPENRKADDEPAVRSRPTAGRRRSGSRAPARASPRLRPAPPPARATGVRPAEV